MNIEQLRSILKCSMNLDPNDDFGIEKCWEEMTAVLSENIAATIDFFENDCTDEEFYWLSAIFEDVAEKTQSKEFLSTICNRLNKVIPENYHQESFETEHMRKWVDYKEYVRSINVDIEFAKERVL